MTHYHPDKTIPQLARETGIPSQWVQRKCKVFQLPLKRAPKTNRIEPNPLKADDPGLPTRGNSGFKQIKEWPEGIVFKDEPNITDGGTIMRRKWDEWGG